MRKEEQATFSDRWRTYKKTVEGSRELILWPYLRDQLPIPPGSRICDLGCGTGDITRRFVRFSPVSVVGMDINEMMLHEALEAKTDKLCYYKRDLAMPMGDEFKGNFDIAVAICLIMHFPDNQLEVFLNNLSRMLQFNGHAYLICPSVQWIRRMRTPQKISDDVYRLIRDFDGVEITEYYRTIDWLREFTGKIDGIELIGSDEIRIKPGLMLEERYANNVGETLFDVAVITKSGLI